MSPVLHTSSTLPAGVEEDASGRRSEGPRSLHRLRASAKPHATIPVQRPSLGHEELEAVAEVFASRWLGMGAVVRKFEEAIAQYVGVKHVVAVNTGTSALHITLASLGFAPGDEVIVPSLTFVGCSQAILAAGLRPIFCEVRPDTLTVDVDDMARRISPRTRAVMPVHYGGMACQMDDILRLARERGLRVVEDAAHAFGSMYRGRRIGAFGDVACFSFDPIKNITCGEGGAVATNDDTLAQAILRKRIVGMDRDSWSRYRDERSWFYEVATQGFRYHMSDLNAAIGLAQLKKLDQFRQRKQALVKRYDAAFHRTHGLELVVHNDETFPFFYVLKVRGPWRDELIEFLNARAIMTGVHYIPNHLQPLFAPYRVCLPVTEKVWREIVTLPLYDELSEADCQAVINGVKDFFAARTSPQGAPRQGVDRALEDDGCVRKKPDSEVRRA